MGRVVGLVEDGVEFPRADALSSTCFTCQQFCQQSGRQGRLRRHGQQGAGRFEAETLAFHRKVRAAFLARAAEFPARFVTLDATRTPEELADAAWAELARRENGTGTLFPASCRA